MLSDVFVSTEQLEQELTQAKQSGGQTSEVLKKLMFAYMQSYNNLKLINKTDDTILNRVKEISQEVETMDSMSKDSLYSALMEFFTDTEDLETALAMKDKISPFFRLDSFKVLNLATLLVKKDKVNAAINILGEHRNRQLRNSNVRSSRDRRNDFRIMREKSINRLLNAMIDKRVDTNVIRKVFEICVDINLNQVNKTIAGPLIKMHLINRDYQSALKEFLFCANTYKTLPWNLELMRIFIENDDKTSLGMIVNQSNQVFGPNSTRLDLAAAYIYNGAKDEALAQMDKITQFLQKRVELLCDKFTRDGKLDELSTFVQMCQSKPGVDNQRLFQLLIRAYKNAGQHDKADQVLNSMKPENVARGS